MDSAGFGRNSYTMWRKLRILAVRFAGKWRRRETRFSWRIV